MSPRWADNNLTSNYSLANEVTIGNGDYWGFSIYYSIDPYDRYANGIYKVSNNESSAYFYIDFRDSLYGANIGCGYSADFIIKYDAGSNSYSYKGTGQSSYSQISVGEYVPIWKINSNNTKPYTSNFNNYWTNCLVNIEQPLENNNRLSLVYGPHPTMSNVTEYYIYRAVNTNDSTNENNYVLYGKTADSIFVFKDISVLTEYPIDKFHYFVKAKNTGGLSSKTNIVVMQGAIEWSKALSIINDNDNPRLNWGPNTDEYEIINYKVYRALVTKNSNPPAENSYNLIYTTGNSTTYTYKDEEVAFGSTYDVYYYVKATKSDNSLTDRTNIEKIVGTLVKRGLEENERKYSLSQNYPNPFNPTTIINYELKIKNLYL